MGRPPIIPAETKTRVVLSVLAGEVTIAEAARREKISEQSIGRWKADFLEAGKTALAAGKSGPSTREQQLEAEVAELTQALGEAAWSCGSGRSLRRAGWALRGPRGDPSGGGHVDHEVLPGDRHARTDLASLAGQGPCRWPAEGSVAAASPNGGGRAGAQARPGAPPAWGHRKIWAMVRHDGHVVSSASVLRLLREEALILPAEYQKERRKLAQRRKAAFATEPTGPNQVWQLDFSEFETTTGGTWRIAGCRDYWSK
jgi:transposase-like protein